MPRGLRLGLLLSTPAMFLGTAGSSLYRASTFSEPAGHFLGSPPFQTHPEPPPTASCIHRLKRKGTACHPKHWRLPCQHFDETDPFEPDLLASVKCQRNFDPPMGTEPVNWLGGAVTTDGAGSFTQILYAMSSNQGIQPLPSPFPNFHAGFLALWRNRPPGWMGFATAPPISHCFQTSEAGFVRPLFFPSGTFSAPRRG